jgi:hypothetical protein
MKQKIPDIELDVPAGWKVVGFRPIEKHDTHYLIWEGGRAKVIVRESAWPGTPVWIVVKDSWEPVAMERVYILDYDQHCWAVHEEYFSPDLPRHTDAWRDGRVFADYQACCRYRNLIETTLRGHRDATVGVTRVMFQPAPAMVGETSLYDLDFLITGYNRNSRCKITGVQFVASVPDQLYEGSIFRPPPNRVVVHHSGPCNDIELTFVQWAALQRGEVVQDGGHALQLVIPKDKT